MFDPKRMIALCSCFCFGKMYIIFPLLSIGALIHIFCLSLIHALMDETAIISMHVCFQPLQHWKKKNISFLLLPLLLRTNLLYSTSYRHFSVVVFSVTHAKKKMSLSLFLPTFLLSDSSPTLI